MELRRKQKEIDRHHANDGDNDDYSGNFTSIVRMMNRLSSTVDKTCRSMRMCLYEQSGTTTTVHLAITVDTRVGFETESVAD